MRRIAVALALVGCAAPPSEAPPSPLDELPAAPRCVVPDEPALLVRLAECPGGIALDDEHVYWGDAAGRQRRFPKCGSDEPPAVLAEVHGAPLVTRRGLAVVSGDGVTRVPFGGGPPVLEPYDAPLQARFTAALLGDDFILQAGGPCIVGEPCTDTAPLFYRVAPGGHTSVVATGPRSNPMGFDLADGAIVFIADLREQPRRLYRLDLADGVITALLETSLNGGVVVHRGLAYVELGFPDDAVAAVPTGGGAPRVVTREHGDWQGLTTDGDALYWTNIEGGLYVVSTRGGGVTTLLPSRRVNGIAVDEGAVFVATCEAELGELWIAAAGPR